jgi:DnaJ-class molecular chaperone
MALDETYLDAWLAQLEMLSFYEVLGVDIAVRHDALVLAYHRFCASFHPDAHRGRTAGFRAKISRIFLRGNEAFRVLDDPSLRARYDDGLRRGEVVPRISLVPTASSTTRLAAPKRWEELVNSPAAREFARRAEALAKAGDVKQARLQLDLARSMDGGNPALTELLATLTAKK